MSGARKKRIFYCIALGFTRRKRASRTMESFIAQQYSCLTQIDAVRNGFCAFPFSRCRSVGFWLGPSVRCDEFAHRFYLWAHGSPLSRHHDRLESNFLILYLCLCTLLKTLLLF